jgi:hypothetical protein
LDGPTPAAVVAAVAFDWLDNAHEAVTQPSFGAVGKSSAARANALFRRGRHKHLAHLACCGLIPEHDKKQAVRGFLLYLSALCRLRRKSWLFIGLFIAIQTHHISLGHAVDPLGCACLSARQRLSHPVISRRPIVSSWLWSLEMLAGCRAKQSHVQLVVAHLHHVIMGRLRRSSSRSTVLRHR